MVALRPATRPAEYGYSAIRHLLLTSPMPRSIGKPLSRKASSSQLLEHRNIIPFQECEKLYEDIPLQLGIVWLSEREAEGIGDRKRTWRTDLGGDIRKHRDRCGRDPVLLDCRLCKTDGLHAHGSYGDHQRDIDVVLNQEVGDRGQGATDKSVGGGN